MKLKGLEKILIRDVPFVWRGLGVTYALMDRVVQMHYRIKLAS